MTDLIQKIINGREVIFDRGRHIYTVDGEKYPSVTTIIDQLDKSRPLMYWAVSTTVEEISPILQEIEDGRKSLKSGDTIRILESAAKKYLTKKQDAASIGSRCHRAIECDLQGRIPEVTDDIYTPFSSYIEWKEGFDSFIPIVSEIITFLDLGKGCRCCGTADFIIELNGKKYLGDIKTSSNIYESFVLQLSAYRKGLVENNKFDIEGMGILRLDRDTLIPEWAEFSDVQYKAGLKAFCDLCKLQNDMEHLRTVIKKKNIRIYRKDGA